MKQKIHLVLLLAIVVVGIRLAVIFYERHQAAIELAKQQAAPLNPDYYVTPKKLYAYDLKSAKQLTRQPVWVKVGYAYPFYAYDPASRGANLSQEPGKLLPLQKLEIRDVVVEVSPKDPGERQVLAIFHQGGNPMRLRLAARGAATSSFIPMTCSSSKIRINCTSTGRPKFGR
jgi:hypothetical protein